MKARTTILIAGVLLVAFFGAVAFFLTSNQPRYHGRTLNSWLSALDDGDREEGLPWSRWVDPIASDPRRKAAADAVRAIGTNAIPFLLSGLTNHEPQITTYVQNFAKQKRWFPAFLIPHSDHRRAAALGFYALGPDAKPALPQLTAALNDPAASKNAAIALVGIGPEGWKVLTREITTNNSWCLVCAIWALGSHGVSAPGTVPALMGQLTNSTGGEAIAGWALGEIATNDSGTLDALIQGLTSSRNDVRFSCANALGNFGTNGERAVPALIKALGDSDSTVSMDASNSLKKIDRNAAKKAGVK